MTGHTSPGQTGDPEHSNQLVRGLGGGGSSDAVGESLQRFRRAFHDGRNPGYLSP